MLTQACTGLQPAGLLCSFEPLNCAALLSLVIFVLGLPNSTNTTPAFSAVLAVVRQAGPVYELYAILVHSGSATFGHYYSYIKSFTDGRWYKFNDEYVTLATEKVAHKPPRPARGLPAARCDPSGYLHGLCGYARL